jgi:hypothetical protein
MGLRLASVEPLPRLEMDRVRADSHANTPKPDLKPEPMVAKASPSLNPLPPLADAPQEIKTDHALTVEELQKALETKAAKPGEALLMFKDAEALAAFQRRAGVYGLKVIASDPRLRAARVSYADIRNLHRELTEHAGDYESVGPNYLARVPGLPQEPPQADKDNAGGATEFRSHGFEQIGATGDRMNWGRGATVAVLDTGITPHSTFRQGQITHIDLVGDGSALDGHGTAMASLIAGSGANAEGVAPYAKLLDIRVAGANGYSDTATLSAAIMKAADMGANVINISLGAFGSSPMLESAVNYAIGKNILIVAAAGNEGMNQLASPAAIPGVIGVGAVDASGKQAYFSNSGNNLAFLAPGVGIVSGYSDGRIVIGNGTSQSAAITTGIIAKLISDGYQRANIPALLQKSTQKIEGNAQQVGAGIVRLP